MAVLMGNVLVLTRILNCKTVTTLGKSSHSLLLDKPWLGSQSATLSTLWRKDTPLSHLQSKNSGRFTASTSCGQNLLWGQKRQCSGNGRTDTSLIGTIVSNKSRAKKFASSKQIISDKKAAAAAKISAGIAEKCDNLQRKRAVVSAGVAHARQVARERLNSYRENVFTIPNFLSLSRILSCPLLGYWVCTNCHTYALGLFTYAAVSDMLDGQIARRWPSQQSAAGSVLDPLADKLLIGTLFLSLTYSGAIPLPLTSLIILRDASLLTGSFYLRYLSLPKPKTLVRYFDPSLASMQFEPTTLSKANTTIQLGLVGASLIAPVFDFVGHPGLMGLCWLTAATTFGSGVEYALRKDTYRFLHKQDATKSDGGDPSRDRSKDKQG